MKETGSGYHNNILKMWTLLLQFQPLPSIRNDRNNYDGSAVKFGLLTSDAGEEEQQLVLFAKYTVLTRCLLQLFYT